MLAVAVVLLYARFADAATWTAHIEDAPARSAIETLITLFALAGAVLLTTGFRVMRSQRDLLLVASLVAAGLTNLVFGALPAYGDQTAVDGAGARMVLMLLVSIGLLAAALVPRSATVPRGRRVGRLTVPAACLLVVLGQVIVAIVGTARIVGEPGSFGMPAIACVIGFALLGVAALGFIERRELGERGVGLLAIAALMLAAAELSRLAVPLIPADWVTPAEVLRLGFFGLMLAYAVGVYLSSRERMAQDAVAAERLRIARELHDGLAQDLAFIATHSERFARGAAADHRLAVAAAHALDASRGKIADLETLGVTDPPG